MKDEPEAMTAEADHGLDQSGGEFACIVEVAEHIEVNSREEAVQVANKMKADIENDAAFKRFKIGRAGVRRLE